MKDLSSYKILFFWNLNALNVGIDWPTILFFEKRIETYLFINQNGQISSRIMIDEALLIKILGIAMITSCYHFMWKGYQIPFNRALTLLSKYSNKLNKNQWFQINYNALQTMKKILFPVQCTIVPINHYLIKPSKMDNPISLETIIFEEIGPNTQFGPKEVLQWSDITLFSPLGDGSLEIFT